MTRVRLQIMRLTHTYCANKAGLVHFDLHVTMLLAPHPDPVHGGCVYICAICLLCPLLHMLSHVAQLIVSSPCSCVPPQSEEYDTLK